MTGLQDYDNFLYPSSIKSFLVNHSKCLSSAPFMGEDLTVSQRQKGTYRENDNDYSFTAHKPPMPLLLNRKKSRQNEEFLAHLNNRKVHRCLTKSEGE